MTYFYELKLLLKRKQSQLQICYLFSINRNITWWKKILNSYKFQYQSFWYNLYNTLFATGDISHPLYHLFDWWIGGKKLFKRDRVSDKGYFGVKYKLFECLLEGLRDVKSEGNDWIQFNAHICHICLTFKLVTWLIGLSPKLSAVITSTPLLDASSRKSAVGYEIYQIEMKNWRKYQVIEMCCLRSPFYVHPCKFRTFKKITAPWLKNLVGYSYLLPKYHVKILTRTKCPTPQCFTSKGAWRR